MAVDMTSFFLVQYLILLATCNCYFLIVQTCNMRTTATVSRVKNIDIGRPEKRDGKALFIGMSEIKTKE